MKQVSTLLLSFYTLYITNHFIETNRIMSTRTHIPSAIMLTTIPAQPNKPKRFETTNVLCSNNSIWIQVKMCDMCALSLSHECVCMHLIFYFFSLLLILFFFLFVSTQLRYTSDMMCMYFD